MSSVITGGLKNVQFLSPLDSEQTGHRCHDARSIYWSIPDRNSPSLYRCCVIVSPESDGGFSAYAPQLPGVFSQGETPEEAVANVKEALIGVLNSYMSDKEDIPWVSEIPCVGKKSKVLWVLVNV